MAKRSLFITVLVVLATVAHAWDPFGMLDSARKAIERAGEDLIGAAKEAFEEASQKLIDDEIGPLIKKVNAMALEDIGVLKNDVEEVVADATKHIEDLIDHAASVAEHLVDKTVEEIKEKIIDETASKIEDIENNFFQGLDGFLQKFYETVSKINCMVQGDVDKVYQDIYKLLAGKGCFWLPDKCCRSGGVAGKHLTEMGDTQLYALEVCRRTSGLDEHTPIEKLKSAYVDCQIAAKKFYCTNFGTATAKDYFTREYNRWGVAYDTWAHPGTSAEVQVTATPSQAQDDCGTPLECYQQAIQKLNEARAEIKDKADMAVVQPLIDAQANEQAVQAEELKVFRGETCPEGWVEAEVTKGYMLVGRPTGGKSGTQINTAFTDGEKSRVVPHGHQVSVTDQGHSHTVTDPGHSHSFEVHDNRAGYTGGGVWTDLDQYGHTSSEKTGVSVDSGTCDVQVSVQDADGEGYPLVYVLLCQRAPKAEAGASKSLVV